MRTLRPREGGKKLEWGRGGREYLRLVLCCDSGSKQVVGS